MRLVIVFKKNLTVLQF